RQRSVSPMELEFENVVRSRFVNRECHHNRTLPNLCNPALPPVQASQNCCPRRPSLRSTGSLQVHSEYAARARWYSGAEAAAFANAAGESSIAAFGSGSDIA